jgi:hypothetical protein
MRACGIVAILLLLAGWLSGCEGVVSGTEVARVALQAADGGPAGRYAPVTFTLSPQMSPVAVNFRTDFTMNVTEAGKWNTYRATLSKDGNVIAARNFNVNHPASSPDNSPPAPTSAIHTLFYVDVQSAGDYEVAIVPVTPVAVTLKDAQVDARRNVQRPPR